MDTSNNGASTEFKLLESAMALFSEKGYRGACIREIIERAGVTRPVLYYYFKNKEDLFCRLVETGFSEMFAVLSAVQAEEMPCRSKLRRIMAVTFQRAEESLGIVRLILQAVFSSPCENLRLDMTKLAEERLRHFACIMQKGLDAGELSGGNAATLALTFVGIMDMHIMAKVHRPEAILTEELADYLVDLFMEGASGVSGDAFESPFPLASYLEQPRETLNRVAET